MLNDIRDDRNIKHLIIPDSVTKIDKQAFAWCRHLESIILPDSIEAIGVFAFLAALALPLLTYPIALQRLEDVHSQVLKPYLY